MSENTNGTTKELSPYWPGDRVIHVDGRVGTILNDSISKMDSPDHGKRYMVRLVVSREFWKVEDLHPDFVKSPNVVQHKDHRTAAVLDYHNGLYVVLPKLADEEWSIDEIAGFADAVTREKLAGDYQAQIDDLQRQVDRLEMANEKLATTPSPALPRDTGKGEKIEVMTLIHADKLSLYAGGGRVREARQEAELENRLAEDWEIVSVNEHTVVFDDDPIFIKSVTLKRENKPVATGNGKTAAVEVSAILYPTPGLAPLSEEEKQEPVARVVVEADFVEVDPPYLTPRHPLQSVSEGEKDGQPAMTFEQALRSGMAWQDVAEIGDREALARGREVYEQRQSVQTWNTPGPMSIGAGVRVQP